MKSILVTKVIYNIFNEDYSWLLQKSIAKGEIMRFCFSGLSVVNVDKAVEK